MYSTIQSVRYLDMKYIYESEVELLTVEFDRYYLIDSIYAENNKVIVILTENKQVDACNWCGEEQVGFF